MLHKAKMASIMYNFSEKPRKPDFLAKEMCKKMRYFIIN